MGKVIKQAVTATVLNTTAQKATARSDDLLSILSICSY